MVIMHTTTATLAPGADITGPKSFYVVHLTLRGWKSTTGPELPSYTTDTVITYVDKWMWDITLYLLELTVTAREPAQSQLLAVGNSYHTSLTRLSPKEMTDEVLSNIFGPTTAPVKVRPAKDDFKPRGLRHRIQCLRGWQFSAARTSSTVSSLFLNLRILAVSFMKCHSAGCAVSLTLCAFHIFLGCKPREQVAAGNENDAEKYVE
jgi:hypothetical protein